MQNTGNVYVIAISKLLIILPSHHHDRLESLI